MRASQEIAPLRHLASGAKNISDSCHLTARRNELGWSVLHATWHLTLLELVDLGSSPAVRQHGCRRPSSLG
jgi:hypothetical protein